MAVADLDDQPAEMSELDLSEDSAITGEDVEDVFGVDEPSAVTPEADGESSADEGDEEKPAE